MRLLNRQRPCVRDAIQVEAKRFGYFPQVFQWRGKRYAVQTIERCWNARRNEPHLCFRVRCREGVFDLYQNLHDNTWRLYPTRA